MSRHRVHWWLDSTGQTANKQSAQSVNEFYSMSEGKDAMKSRYKAEVGLEESYSSYQRISVKSGYIFLQGHRWRQQEIEDS